MHSVDQPDRRADPLGRDAPIRHEATFPLLGVPLTVGSNSAEVIAAAERSFGRWRDLPPEVIAPGPPLHLRLLLHHSQGRAPYAPRQPFVQRLHWPYYLTSCGEGVATANMLAGEAVGFLTPEMLADDLHMRYNLLECLSLVLVMYRDRWPVHAAAVVRDGRALLLVGQSTAGKSTLSYACLRAGWQLLAEDAVYVSLESETGLCAWGVPWRIHLLPDAPRHFPELAAIEPQIQANGKRKLGIEVGSLGPDRFRTYVGDVRVCLLSRHAGPDTSAEQIAREEAIAALTEGLETGFDLSQRALPVAEALVARHPWRITVGSSLEQAVEVLERIAGGVE